MCTEICGTGTQSRTRQCQDANNAPVADNLCAGDKTEDQTCNTEPCPGKLSNNAERIVLTQGLPDSPRFQMKLSALSNIPSPTTTETPVASTITGRMTSELTLCSMEVSSNSTIPKSLATTTSIRPVTIPLEESAKTTPTHQVELRTL